MLVALTLKEMAQGTLLETPSACLLALICMALPFREKAELKVSEKAAKPCFMCLALCLACCLLTAFPQYKNDAQLIKSMHKAAGFPDRKTYADFQKVEEKNVYDKNLGFLSIMYLINRERFDEAEKMIRKRLAYNPSNAIYQFTLGKILYISGDRTKAKGYLAYAVNKLPNLSTPWLLLGDEKKYRLLTDGVFNINKGEIHKNEKRQTLMELFSSMYDVRFQTWYGQKLE